MNDGTRRHGLCFLNVEFYFVTLTFHFHQEALSFFFTFCHKDGVICISEVINIFKKKNKSNQGGKDLVLRKL